MNTEITPADRQRFTTALEAAATVPTEAELADAPILANWFSARAAFRNRPVLVGIVQGHPSLPEDVIQTSGVLALNAEDGYARTQSRWYRLGKRAADMPQDEMTTIMQQAMKVSAPIADDEFSEMISTEKKVLEGLLA